MIWFFRATDSVEEGEVDGGGDEEEEEGGEDDDDDDEDELNGFGKEGNDIFAKGRLRLVVLKRCRLEWKRGREQSLSGPMLNYGARTAIATGTIDAGWRI